MNGLQSVFPSLGWLGPCKVLCCIMLMINIICIYIHTYIHTSIYPYMLEASERSDCCRLDLVLVRGLVEQ